jgi:hypothetical protein
MTASAGIAFSHFPKSASGASKVGGNRSAIHRLANPRPALADSFDLPLPIRLGSDIFQRSR